MANYKHRELKIIEDIVGINNWYARQSRGYNDIDEIMYNRRMLATLRVSLGEELGRLKGELKGAEYRYETIKNQKRTDFMLKGSSNQKADWNARANCVKELKIMQDAETYYWSCYNMFTSTKELLSEMAQTIAKLRDEQKDDKFYGDR